MEKYGFVYIWKDKSRRRYYIGSHWGTDDDGYICSSDAMYEARKRRPNDFKRRIISKVTTNRQDLLDEEQRWLDMIPKEEFGRRYYNINDKVFLRSWWANEETKRQVSEKVSKSLKGNVPWNKGKIGVQVGWNKGTKGVMKANKTSFSKEHPLTKKIIEKRKMTLRKKFENGYIIHNKGKKWINDGYIETQILHNEQMPKGFKFGRCFNINISNKELH